MTIEQVKQLVNASFPSVFSKEDVIALLDKITVNEHNYTESIADAVWSSIERVLDENERSSDIVDLSSAEFSLSYNEVQLDHVDVDLSGLRSELEKAIRDYNAINEE